MNPTVEKHADDLRTRTGKDVEVKAHNGFHWVVIKGVELPAGWNQRSTTIVIKVPPAFPVGAPDCFWADSTLRLASGAMPRSSGMNPDFGGGQTLWFSFHVQKWNPNRDDLFRYFNVIRNRLEQAV